MAKEIDARGLSCPQPVFLTIKAIDEGKEILLEGQLGTLKDPDVAVEEQGEDIILTLSK